MKPVTMDPRATTMRLIFHVDGFVADTAALGSRLAITPTS
jgi:hypothetical protein